MQVKDLKLKIENNEVPDTFLILECPENYFVADQYIKEIARLKGKEIKYNNSFSVVDNYLSVVTVDELKDDILVKDNLIVKCKCMKNKKYNEYVITIPKLETWQIYNYVGRHLPGLSKDQLSELCSSLNFNIYSLQNEIDKLKLFTKEAQSFMYEGVKNTLLPTSVFDLSNALLKRDNYKVKQLLNQEYNGLSLRSVLLSNLKVILAIQTNSVLTPKDLGVSEKQYYAISKYNVGYYTTEELTKRYKILYNIEDMVKTGKLTNSNITDYIVVNML